MNENSDFNLAKARVMGAKSASIHELERFTDFLRDFDPELTPTESMLLAAYILHELPAFFMNNPSLTQRLREITTGFKRQ